MTSAIRAATPGDADGVAACVERAYSHYIARIGKPPGPMLDDYRIVIAEHSVLVVDARAGIVGVLVLIDSDDGLLLDNVAVDPAMQKRGLGQRLLERAESEALARGYGSINLYTHEQMGENIPYYAKRGYREYERKTVSGYRRIYMRKSLRVQGGR